MQVKKSPKADLEKRKTIFLQLGLVVALGVMLVAFEWNDSDKSSSSLGNLSVEDVMEEEIENTFRDEKPPEPEPEPEQVQEVVEELNIVENDVDVEDDFNFDSESNEKDKTETTIKDFGSHEVEEEVEPISFAVVEEKPTFPGGEGELLKFIAENTKYPEIAKESGIKVVFSYNS